MGTKEHPNHNDCYNKALPSEPMFTLLARDSSAPGIVRAWATLRMDEIGEHARPMSDMAVVTEAMQLADDMEAWRRNNNGAWRSTPLAIAAACCPVNRDAFADSETGEG